MSPGVVLLERWDPEHFPVTCRNFGVEYLVLQILPRSHMTGDKKPISAVPANGSNY